MDGTQNNVGTGKQTWIQRVSTTRSELHEIKKPSGDDSRDGGWGGMERGENQRQSGGGGHQTDPDEDIYRTLMNFISKMGEVVGNGSIKE